MLQARQRRRTSSEKVRVREHVRPGQAVYSVAHVQDAAIWIRSSCCVSRRDKLSPRLSSWLKRVSTRRYNASIVREGNKKRASRRSIGRPLLSKARISEWIDFAENLQTCLVQRARSHHLPLHFILSTGCTSSRYPSRRVSDLCE